MRVPTEQMPARARRAASTLAAAAAPLASLSSHRFAQVTAAMPLVALAELLLDCSRTRAAAASRSLRRAASTASMQSTTVRMCTRRGRDTAVPTPSGQLRQTNRKVLRSDHDRANFGVTLYRTYSFGVTLRVVTSLLSATFTRQTDPTRGPWHSLPKAEPRGNSSWYGPSRAS